MAHTRIYLEVRVSCQIRHCQPTAERQRIAGQVRAGQCDRCGLWTRATLNPRKFFLVLVREVHITIGGGEIGVCPLSFPYHAT